jgi:hypothetical protein
LISTFYVDSADNSGGYCCIATGWPISRAARRVAKKSMDRRVTFDVCCDPRCRDHAVMQLDAGCFTRRLSTKTSTVEVSGSLSLQPTDNTSTNQLGDKPASLIRNTPRDQNLATACIQTPIARQLLSPSIRFCGETADHQKTKQ